jgi:hypothetical protein
MEDDVDVLAERRGFSRVGHRSGTARCRTRGPAATSGCGTATRAATTSRSAATGCGRTGLTGRRRILEVGVGIGGDDRTAKSEVDDLRAGETAEVAIDIGRRRTSRAVVEITERPRRIDIGGLVTGEVGFDRIARRWLGLWGRLRQRSRSTGNESGY